MQFANNLQFLRKKFSMTQEELADYLGVSRQSVSKWETGEAYPETEKLIAMCDKFEVTLDELVRKDITAQSDQPQKSDIPTDGAPATQSDEPDSAVYPDEIGYVRHMDGFSRRISVGVTTVLIGVALCILFGGLYDVYADSTVFEILALVSLSLFLAAATFFFVFAGIRHSEFTKNNPEIKNVFTKAEKQAFSKKFALAMAILVPGIIIDALIMTILSAIADSIFNVPEAVGIMRTVTVSAFMLILAFLVGGLCYFGIQKSKYDMQAAASKPQTTAEKISGAICGIIMISATVIFLLIGILRELWHPGWVVFPVGGLLCGIVNIILGVKHDKE